jgi:membrane protein implicated in regulation of membrane protease activity
MAEGRFLAEHYRPIVVLIYTLLMAVIIFFLAIPLKVQLILLVISVAVFIFVMRPVAVHEPPMGGPEGVARHTGSSSESARSH